MKTNQLVRKTTKIHYNIFKNITRSKINFTEKTLSLTKSSLGIVLPLWEMIEYQYQIFSFNYLTFFLRILIRTFIHRKNRKWDNRSSCINTLEEQN